MIRPLVLVLLALIVVGCREKQLRPRGMLRLDLDRANPRSFIAYYFGGLASVESSNPFDAGLVTESYGEFFLNTEALNARLKGRDTLVDANADGTLDWDELEPFLQKTYYGARGIPSLFDSLDVADGSSDRLEFYVDGVMTTAGRRIHVPRAALRNALEHFTERGNEIVYPVQTVIVADHVANGDIVERTWMRKREDGYWDYAVFDSMGARIPATGTPPKSLAVPTQCVGCHLGSRLYEPEKSFPAPAAPGPSGPRRIHWPHRAPEPELVRYFDEHRKRSDGILGVYGTLYVARLREMAATDSISEDDLRLLQSLGL